jgi:cellobiose phosphorylase
MKIYNKSGLCFSFLENGSIEHIELEPIRISLKSTTSFAKPGANLFLRKRTSPIEFKALMGPESNSVFQVKEDVFITSGNWDGIEYTCVLQLSPKSESWQWRVDIANNSDKIVELDLIYLQDIGLKQINNGLVNEYYVSQYLERLIFKDKNYGSVICCRQNMAESVGNPWLMMACKNGALTGLTDGMQFYGKTHRETGIPEGLLSETLSGNYAGESSVVALQENPFYLESGAKHTGIFVAAYLSNHPKASSVNDLNLLSNIFQEFDQKINITPQKELTAPAKNIFNTAPFLPIDDLTPDELNGFFGKERRLAEKEDGKLLSFFCSENNHVILRTKETQVDRPHGHIIQAKAGFAPDENIVSTTSFAFGVFNSHISQGNTNFNVFLSVCTSQFNLLTQSGQRIFVELDGQYYLLGVPSAFEMGLNHCRWIYKFGDNTFQVRTWASKTAPQINLDFKVLSGKKVSLLITHDFDALNSWKITKGTTPDEFIALPEKNSMIQEKFPDAQFRMLVNSTHINYTAHTGDILFNKKAPAKIDSLFVLKVEETTYFSISILGEINSKINFQKIQNTDEQWLSDCKDAQSNWQMLSLNLKLHGTHTDTNAIQEILPWYGMNAITHFLTPYGLEQFSGAAWGTRDVSQGPIDLLLTMEKYDETKQVLRIIFSNQNSDGGWPQWWMFDSYSKIRAADSHGDVFYWVIIALSDYIKVTGDIKILDERLPFFNENNNAAVEVNTIDEHVDRLIQMIVNSFLPGTALVPFGGGDWNDSLQPVSKELAERMISSWTVEMNFQAFNQYQAIYELTGEHAKANKLKEICSKIKTDFNNYLVKDGVVAGYGLVEADKSISVLLHPSDTKTGIHYSILPMNRGVISGIFTKDQAENHQKIINQHLKGPDGARLMDHPLKYKGGIQSIFQRAESSTFFGREIGLMYVHEHIRYAESQARIGNADEFIKALRQAIPVAYKDLVPSGDTRQANCYYSSSDIIFESRYNADEHYEEINSGTLRLKGGWRVYSSGPGIYVSMIVSRLLGIRIEFGNIIFDPVIPKSMHGISASMIFKGKPIVLKFKWIKECCGPKVISVNEKEIKFIEQKNEYRKGGAIINLDYFLNLLNSKDNKIEISL